MRRAPLPDGFGQRPFTTGEAARAGIPKDRLRAKDLDRHVWGVRRADPSAATLRVRCEMLAARLPAGTFFTHTTAALLLGAPLPIEVGRQAELHVGVAAPARAPHARGILGHSMSIERGEIAVSHGLRHTSAARTWCDLATQLTLPDLVAVGDYIVHWRLPHTSIDELGQRMLRHPNPRGARLLRRAHSLLNDRAESRPESIARVTFALGGLPDPRVNLVIVDTETGPDVRTDFAFEEWKFIIEYQGDYHRTKRQWRKDMTRRARLEARDWYVMEINADDLASPDELVARIRGVLVKRGFPG